MQYIERPNQTTLEKSLPEHIANILAKRGKGLDFLNKSLKDLPNPLLLSDMQQAADTAIRHQFNRVLCVVDYDTDGISSGAVLKTGLKELGFTNVEIMVTDRHHHGYGFSDGVVEIINEMIVKPSLIITADLGSSDGERLAKMTNSDVIVTDHHHISETTPPRNISAFVNPHRKDVEHGYHHPICGAMVAWNLIAAIRAVAKKDKNTKIKTDYDIKLLLDFVAVATIADMVDMGDYVNRVATKYGLSLINKGSRPAWQVLKTSIGTDKIVREDTIGFQISPRINALSRMGDTANTALDWLTAVNYFEANQLFANMSDSNEIRKEDQTLCESLALMQAQQQADAGRFVLVCYVPEAGHGVVGLAAGKLVTKFGLPSVVLSVKENGEIVGSARSIAGYNIREAIVKANEATGGLLKKYGGHAAAAGLSLARNEDIKPFAEALNAVVLADFKNQRPKPVAYHDGEIPKQLLTLSQYSEMVNLLSPFGQGFPAPTFFYKTEVMRPSVMGNNGQHLRFSDKNQTNIVWFNHTLEDVSEFRSFEGVVSINENVWRGEKTLQLMVV
jgi:single-stranded-DNA-specific exonuclease